MSKGPCGCGCGHRTSIAAQTRTAIGHVRGQPTRFLVGHNNRLRTGEKSTRWKGGRRLDGQGYVMLCRPDHPRANPGGYVREHIVMVEAAIGKRLRDGAQVHHVNGDRADNSRGNLVACHDQPYHQLLHQRQRALDGCGNPNWRTCYICQQWDDPSNLNRRRLHPECERARARRKARAA